MNRIKEIQKGFKEREAHRREMMDKLCEKHLRVMLPQLRQQKIGKMKKVLDEAFYLSWKAK